MGFADLMVERTMNTMVLVLWRYLNYFECRMYFSSKRNHLTEFINEMISISKLNILKWTKQILGCWSVSDVIVTVRK